MLVSLIRKGLCIPRDLECLPPCKIEVVSSSELARFNWTRKVTNSFFIVQSGRCSTKKERLSPGFNTNPLRIFSNFLLEEMSQQFRSLNEPNEHDPCSSLSLFMPKK